MARRSNPGLIIVVAGLVLALALTTLNWFYPAPLDDDPPAAAATPEAIHKAAEDAVRRETAPADGH